MQICLNFDFKTNVLKDICYIFSYLWSVFCLDLFLKTISPSLYDPADYLLSLVDSRDSTMMSTSRQIKVPSKLSLVILKELSELFFLPRFAIIFLLFYFYSLFKVNTILALSGA